MQIVLEVVLHGTTTL